MSKKQFKNEQAVLRVAFLACAAIAVSEILMSWYSGSQAVLMDGVFDVADAAVSSIFLIFLPVIYRPATEKMPYGYAQLESVFILVKGSMMTVVTVNLIVENIRIMASGGSEVDAALVGTFELGVAVFSVLVLMAMRHWNKNVNSQAVQAEITSWKNAAACGLGVAGAFLVQHILMLTPLAFLGRYVDQIVAIIIAVTMLPQMLKLVIQSLRSIVLIAPKQDSMQLIRQTVESDIASTSYRVSFYDIVQTGRKLWVEIYVKSASSLLDLQEMRALRNRLSTDLGRYFSDIYVELTPDFD